MNTRDCKQGRINTALSRLNNRENIQIDFEGVKKLAEYHNSKYAMMREAIEIISAKEACNDMTHATIDGTWMMILKKSESAHAKRERRRDGETGREDVIKAEDAHE